MLPDQICYHLDFTIAISKKVETYLCLEMWSLKAIKSVHLKHDIKRRRFRISINQALEGQIFKDIVNLILESDRHVCVSRSADAKVDQNLIDEQ